MELEVEKMLIAGRGLEKGRTQKWFVLLTFLFQAAETNWDLELILVILQNLEFYRISSYLKRSIISQSLQPVTLSVQVYHTVLWHPANQIV